MPLSAKQLVVACSGWLARVSLASQPPYWFDPRIHNLGNAGPGGALHALVAPLATRALDAHFRQDVRARVRSRLPDGWRVIDLGCGTGQSTPRGELGVDTSLQMLAVAQLLHPETTFAQGNAESFGEDMSCDVALLSFVLHEAPFDARERMLRNSLRIARKLVLVLDIAPTFVPPRAMLRGEPYLLDFQSHIESQIAMLPPACAAPRSFELVESSVRLWAIEVIR